MGLAFDAVRNIHVGSRRDQPRDTQTPIVSRYSRYFASDFGALRMLFFSTSNTDAVS